MIQAGDTTSGTDAITRSASTIGLEPQRAVWPRLGKNKQGSQYGDEVKVRGSNGVVILFLRMAGNVYPLWTGSSVRA